MILNTPLINLLQDSASGARAVRRIQKPLVLVLFPSANVRSQELPKELAEVHYGNLALACLRDIIMCIDAHRTRSVIARLQNRGTKNPRPLYAYAIDAPAGRLTLSAS